MMLKNYLKIGFRSLLASRWYTLINVGGLALGMTAFVLMFLWIRSETTYDRFYSKTDRIYQVYNRGVANGNPMVWGSTPVPLVPELTEKFAEVEQATRYLPVTMLISSGDKHINASGAFADSSFFILFDFSFLRGNPGMALNSVQSIVVTRKFAEKYFGSTDVLGKTVTIDHRDNRVISGVLEDIPGNSTFADVTYFLPWSYFRALGWGSDDWSSNNYFSYVLLGEHADAVKVNHKIQHVVAAHLAEAKINAAGRTIFLHPADKWHLYSQPENGELVGGKIHQIRLFSVIAIFVLLIACVNFVNLTTARSAERAREVGVRKVVGAGQFTLISQFMVESVMISLLAGLVATLLVLAVLPYFGTLVNTKFVIDLRSVGLWIATLGFPVLTGILAGMYPALFLSRYQPVRALKGAVTSGRQRLSLRQTLVVIQFSFSMLLIIGTLVIRKQIDHGQTRDAGVEREGLIYSALPEGGETRFGVMRQELLKSGAITSVTKSLGPPTDINTRQWGVSWPGSGEKEKDVEFNLFGADADFAQTTGAKILQGREVDIRSFPTDSTAVLLNEAAVKVMGLKDPVGTVIRFQGIDRRVAGVVKDFIFDSPYKPVAPVIVEGPSGKIPHQWITMRLDARNSDVQNLDKIRSVFTKHNPGYPFDFSYADDTYAGKFASDRQTGAVTAVFTGLSLFISCLGLLGLSIFSAHQRTKEIGIRKVLGANIAGILALLTKEFSILLIIAFVISFPIGYILMNRWLMNYDYRISIGFDVPLLTLLTTVLLVVCTVGIQSVRAALMNPVKSLKNE